MLTLGFDCSTGSNEIYYPQLVPSLCAKAVASWAIYFWIKEKHLLWVALLSIAGYLQPLVGVQLFIVLSFALFLKSFHEKKLTDFPWTSMLLYLIVTLPW